jgi:hypothetical protein
MRTIGRAVGWFFAVMLAFAGFANLVTGLDSWLLSVVQFAIAAAIWYWALRTPGRSAEAVKREADAWLRAVVERGHFEPVPMQGVIARPGEHCALQCAEAELQEFRSMRRSLGAGSSVHVGRVPIYFGGASSRSFAELRSAGRGKLFLTTERIVFAGAERTLEARLKDLIAIEAYTDGLRLGLRSHERPVYLTGFNGALWAAMIGMLGSGQLTAQNFVPDEERSAKAA